MVTTQPYHDIAAYRTLPLNGYEKVTIVNAVLIPDGLTGGSSWGTDTGWLYGTTYSYSPSETHPELNNKRTNIDST